MKSFLLITSFLCVINSTYSQKMRIAVFSFENNPVVGYVRGAGEAMSDMITTELVKTQKFSVLERMQLANLIQEYNLELSGMIDPSSAVELGKVLGVEYAVFGSLTQYNVNTEQKSGNSFGINISATKHEATVGIDVRMVSTKTGEIVAADNIVETASKTKSNIINSFGDSTDKLIGEASRKAVKKIVELLTSQVTGETTTSITMKILMVKGEEAYINIGKNGGVENGDMLIIMDKGEELIDADTGESFGFIENEIGMIEVVDNSLSNGKVSRCKIVSGENIQKSMLLKGVN